MGLKLTIPSLDVPLTEDLVPHALPSVLRDDICPTPKQRKDQHTSQYSSSSRLLTPSIDHPRKPAQDRQRNANPKRCAASYFCERADRRQDNTEKVEEDVAAC